MVLSKSAHYVHGVYSDWIPCAHGVTQSSTTSSKHDELLSSDEILTLISHLHKAKAAARLSAGFCFVSILL